ncbi:MAG: protein-L-isoaspartate(D-aspartate) O-methyltransferase [Deltaproteobacteria bacterium]|nr:protein-L-isoaspartate(D-aspartate) O-methyltransferase [Deltaproteobacteria bacterium]MBW1933681.1 protein-L-isoaspartate(D-aspartate) O-methyltransferase [Deltaproteobacteria bacterium]MBW1939636.1 protein-L-isoaspartate(D-aspartate) O-methyltransferase [Deltaproteobacteria bacterium]MBW1965735.1 protein-L-isoaspartate(D-aspartate) O-methyltransferase [Deltaproteobacteria bacterium]MBW2351364.1 protein-L-isoaspartate(D-aspartate) O-methyltransferase [Deltaproteobacteria bacterium]
MFKVSKAKHNNQFRISRDRMVAHQIEQRGIKNPRVLEAFRNVPRHLFVEEALWDQAYSDFPLPIGSGQTISQPYVVALMTQQLGLKGDEKVLEVGTGSGYQTAILAELAPVVCSVERIHALLPKARNILEKLKYTNIMLKLDDGTWGWQSEAPFDAIIVTAGSPSVPQPLIDQLNDPGVLIIPVGDEYSQVLVKVIRSQGKIHQEDMGGVRFVKLVGDHGWNPS